MGAAGPFTPDDAEQGVPPAFDLMFTFDGEFGDELCLGLSRCPKQTGDNTVDLHQVETAVPLPFTPPGWSGCHKFAPIAALLGSNIVIGGSEIEHHHSAAQAKTAQLLMQWLALPTTDTLLSLIFSKARRALPLSRDLLEEQRGTASRAALPVAPAPMHSRWSVSGGTPRRPPVAPDSATPRKRRLSEPTIPVLAFATPPALHPPNARLSFDDSNVMTGSSSATPRRSSTGRSPGSDLRAATATEIVHSPLSYFGTQPNMPSRFLQVPQGDGGIQDIFEAAAEGGGVLSAEALLTLITERLDLPRAVARLVVKRSQQAQKRLDEAAGGRTQASSNGAPPSTPVTPPAAVVTPTAARTPEEKAAAAAGSPATQQQSTSGAAADAMRAVSFGAFFSVYGRHRPEETDRIRLFRLIKGGSAPWLLPSDVTDLVWAVSETHAGLEFLRDSTEFLAAYVQTTSLRILWALSGAGTQRITLQHWRHSSISEVLFHLDEESDINLARDFFSYNHFYVIW